MRHRRPAAHGFQVKRGGVVYWGEDEWVLDWQTLVDPNIWSWQVDMQPLFAGWFSLSGADATMNEIVLVTQPALGLRKVRRPAAA